MSKPDRETMLDRAHPVLSVRRQCVLLSLAHSGVYRPKSPVGDDDLAPMRRLDELFTAWPFLGSRGMTAMLRAGGHRINRKRVQRLIRAMGIAALGPKPRTSKPAPGHTIFPYLPNSGHSSPAARVFAPMKGLACIPTLVAHLNVPSAGRELAEESHFRVHSLCTEGVETWRRVACDGVEKCTKRRVRIDF